MSRKVFVERQSVEGLGWEGVNVSLYESIRDTCLQMTHLFCVTCRYS